MGKIIFSNFEHSKNELSSIDIFAELNFTCESDRHFLNVFFFIACIEDGILTSSNFEHSENALSPIVAIVFGILILVNEEHPENE